MDGLDQTGDANWRVEDGALVADKERRAAHLVTKDSTRITRSMPSSGPATTPTPASSSRCDPEEIGAKTCYEVNIFDTRPDPSYGTGSIVYFAEVNPMPKAGGKWNTFEITAKGRNIIVMLNGKKTVDLHNGMFDAGPLHAAIWRRRGEIPQGRGQKL